jgi:hypothetical protein
MPCVVCQSRLNSAAARFTLEHALSTSTANASKSIVNRECFPAHGTAIVLTPQTKHFERDTRARRTV